jgi:hypothetical protein
MSQANETTRAILFYLASRGAFVWRNNVGMLRDRNDRPVRYGLIGSSDVLGCIAGKFIAVEIKTGRDKLRPAQEQFLDEIRCRGGIALVVRPDDWQEVIDAAIGDL